MYYVYVLRSLKDGNHYIGSTNNLDARLNRHNRGYVRSTSYRRPFEMIYFETYDTLIESRKRELLIKRMKGGIEFKKLIGLAKEK